MVCQVVVCGVMGRDVTFDAEGQMKIMTVGQLKGKIAQRAGIPGDNAVRLIYTDKDLDDDSKLLSEYGIKHRSVIQMVMKLSGGLTA